jgi:hypothetical protein
MSVLSGENYYVAVMSTMYGLTNNKAVYDLLKSETFVSTQRFAVYFRCFVCHTEDISKWVSVCIVYVKDILEYVPQFCVSACSGSNLQYSLKGFGVILVVPSKHVEDPRRSGDLQNANVSLVS